MPFRIRAGWRFSRCHAVVVLGLVLGLSSAASASTWFLKQPDRRPPIEIRSLAASGSSLGDEWSSQRVIELVNHSTTPLLNYPVKVTLTFTTASLTYDDVRFTATDGETFLRHWRESSEAGSAIFFVNVPYLAPSATTSILIRYGNPDVRTASDGDATFPFFDDFQSLSGVVKSEGNPLFEGIEPSVLKEGNEYWLYYDLGGIYRRTSPDGITWSAPTLITGVSGQYVHVYKDFDRVTYRMLFSDGLLQAIRLATSTDGVNFVDQGIVFDTDPGQWYSDGLFDPCEIMVGGTYYLYFGGRGSDPNGRIGLATSSSGRPGSYTEVAESPVIEPSGSGITSTGVFDADVLQYDPGKYMMFYTGYNASDSRQLATYATSVDLVSWTQSGKELYWISQDWETEAIFGPNEPSVLVENDRYTVWYRGTANAHGGPNYIGRATIPRHPDTLEPDPESRWSSLNSSIVVADGSAEVSTAGWSRLYGYLYTDHFRLTDGMVEAKMRRTSPSYFNVNLSVRIDAANRLDQSFGAAGTTTHVYLFEHVPAFLSRGNTVFAVGFDDHTYQLALQGSSLMAQIRRAADGAFAEVIGTATTTREGAVGLYLTGSGAGDSSASLDWFRVRQPDMGVTATVGLIEEQP